MNRVGRLRLILAAAMAFYVGSYSLLLERKTFYTYRGRGVGPMHAEYFPAHDLADAIASALFLPLEHSDRLIAPDRWEVPY